MTNDSNNNLTFSVTAVITAYNSEKYNFSDFHRPDTTLVWTRGDLKHSAIERSRPQLYPGMFFVANGCLTVENEFSEVGEILEGEHF